jgi:radical SAM family uncharacterized protein
MNSSINLYAQIEPLLPFVECPGQYVGQEINSIAKDHQKVDVSFALSYPDTYAVGMSHLGLRILYDIINKHPKALAERVFAPWIDMDKAMREHKVPLHTLETFRPVRDFDVFGMSLQFELNAANVLQLLDLAGIPLRAKDRTEEDPIVLGGGPVVCNPEPFAPFFDCFFVGEAEEGIVEIIDVLVRAKKQKLSRRDTLLALAHEVAGIYVPMFYEPVYENGVQVGLKKLEDVPNIIHRRWVKDLDAAPFPTAQIVPYVNIVHDRLSVEVMRGCSHGCRFCQASSIYRPVRSRSAGKVLELVREGLKATGFDDVSLLSLSTGEYPYLRELMPQLVNELDPEGVSISLPSLRITPELMQVPELLAAAMKGGMTLAPECATDRLRSRINKKIKNDELYSVIEAAYREGWRTVKLYFMMGLPGETQEDLDGIADMAHEAAALKKRFGRGPGKVNVSVSCFVPKPQTPFQWSPMAPVDKLDEKRAAILDRLKSLPGHKNLNVHFHNREMGEIEAMISRGNRRTADVIEAAYREGEIFSAWDEYFRRDRWAKAIAATGADLDDAAHKEWPLDRFLPWAHIDAGVSQEHLKHEWQKSLAGEETADCREGRCHVCGAACKEEHR